MNSLVTYVLQVSLILAVFGGIATGLIRFARRPGQLQRGPLELVARLPLEGRRVIYLLRAGGHLIVVGGSEAGLIRLGELPEGAVSSLEADLTRPSPAPPSLDRSQDQASQAPVEAPHLPPGALPR